MAFTTMTATAQEAETDVTPENNIAEYCNEVQSEFHDLASVLPMKVDETTTVTVMEAEINDYGNCQASLEYDVNEPAFIAGIVSASDGNFTEEQAIEFLSTQEGHDFISLAMRQYSVSTFEQMGLLEVGMSFDISFNFKGGLLAPLHIEL